MIKLVGTIANFGLFARCNLLFFFFDKLLARLLMLFYLVMVIQILRHVQNFMKKNIRVYGGEQQISWSSAKPKCCTFCQEILSEFVHNTTFSPLVVLHQCLPTTSASIWTELSWRICHLSGHH